MEVVLYRGEWEGHSKHKLEQIAEGRICSFEEQEGTNVVEAE